MARLSLTRENPSKLNTILGGMIVLQLLWICAAWWFAGTENHYKVPLLFAYTVLAGVILLLPLQSVQHWLKTLQKSLEGNPTTPLIILCMGVMLVGIFYAVNLESQFFDEQRSYEASLLLSQQGVSAFFDQYAGLPWLGDQHPPLIILLNGLIFWLFGPNLIFLRLFTLCFALGNIILTYLIGRRFYDSTTGLLAAFFVASSPYLIRLGTRAMLDIQVTFFGLLAIYLISVLVEKDSYKFAVFTGIAIGLGILTKYIMFLVGPVLLSYIVIFGAFKRLFPKLIVAGLVVLLTVLPWFTLAYTKGIMDVQMAQVGGLVRMMANAMTIDTTISDSTTDELAANQQAETVEDPQSIEAFTVAGITVRMNWSSRFALEQLLVRVPSSVGVYFIPLLFIGLMGLWQNRRREDWFVLSWVVLIWISVLITLPAWRYFMLSFPALALIFAQARRSLREGIMQVTLLAVLYCGGALYLYVDWWRNIQVFMIVSK